MLYKISENCWISLDKIVTFAFDPKRHKYLFRIEGSSEILECDYEFGKAMENTMIDWGFFANG